MPLRRLKESEIVAAVQGLSGREREVVGLAAIGLIDKQIGVELGLSLNTLRTYWSRIRTKMGEVPRSALVAAYVACETGKPLEKEFGHLDFEGMIINLDTGMVLASDSVNDLHNLERGVPHRNEDYLQLFHPDDLPLVRKAVESIVSGTVDSVHLTVRVVPPSGVEVRNITLVVGQRTSGKVTKLHAYRVKTMDFHSESEKTVQMGCWIRDYPENLFWFDDDFRTILEIEPETSDLMKALIARIHPDDLETVCNTLPNAIAKNEEWVRYCVRLVKKDGQIYWAQAKGHVSSFGDGRYRVDGSVAVFQ